MKKSYWCWLVLAGLSLVAVSEAAAAQGGSPKCRRNDRVTITDLDMAPDPIVLKQPLRVWKVKLDFDGRRDCEMEIEIRDRANKVVAQEQSVRVRRGINEVSVRPDAAYEFNGNLLCLRITVNLEGTRTDADAKREFCARQVPAWTLK